jgi:hypothetical protein
LWPTPTSSLGTNGGLVTPNKAREGGTLIEALSARTTWPTPQARDFRSGDAITSPRAQRKIAQGWSPNLNDVVKWRTPSASVVDPKSNVVKLTGRKPTDPQVGLADQVGGQLNPTWVEWLMRWPIGWTDLKLSAMDKSPSAQPQLSAC